MSNYTHNSIQLNAKQQEAYSHMARYKNILLTGVAGSGKSSLIKIFVKNYSHVRNIAITSTTGTSALLVGGTTLHSYLGIGYGSDSVETLTNKICTWGWLRKRWNQLECLIIDEVSMLSPDLFDKLEEIARIVRNDERPFGGLQIILSGDFLQLPVVGSEQFCFEAKSWNTVIDEVVYLDQIIRQGDPTFQQVLNSVRMGNVTEEVRSVLDSRIGVELHNSYGIQPTKLYSTNRDVDRVNDVELDKLAEDGRQFYEYEMEIVVYPGVSNRTAAIEKFLKYCPAQQTLQLCLGAQVILLRNIDLSNGLANGSRGVVTSFVGETPVVRFLNGEERVIDYYTWEVVESEKKILRAQQIPLRVAYAISIHRSQGCSLDYAEVDLTNIFSYSQSYVALSRVKSLSGLSILGINYDSIQAHPRAVEFYESLEEKL